MKYELVLVFKPTNNEDIKERVMPKIEKFFVEGKGSLKLTDNWGKRMLAYPINKFKEGIYQFFDAEISSAKLTEISKALKLNTDVLRFLFIKKENI